MNAARQLAGPGPLIPEMLAAVRRHTRLDFGPYLRAMVERRVWNRMLRADFLDPAAYLERLRADPAECERLASAITIKVSRFFRNPGAFAALRDALGDGRGATAWSAGCARGEEAYGIALLAPAIAVLGTDVDPEALGDAERAC
ncbi:MAG TPA: CheR family methyltransferase, partial [Anaeromyxobacter sp.]